MVAVAAVAGPSSKGCFLLLTAQQERLRRFCIKVSFFSSSCRSVTQPGLVKWFVSGTTKCDICI